MKHMRQERDQGQHTHKKDKAATRRVSIRSSDGPNDQNEGQQTNERIEYDDADTELHSRSHDATNLLPIDVVCRRRRRTGLKQLVPTLIMLGRVHLECETETYLKSAQLSCPRRSPQDRQRDRDILP